MKVIVERSVSMENQAKEKKLGILAGGGAYFLWGCLPVYWKLAGDVSDLEILAHRILWSFVFMVLLVFCFGKSKDVFGEITTILKQPKLTLAITLATLLISANWFIFIFSVNSNNILSASMGYYINPIVNVILATIFLKERLSNGEKIAVLSAAIGVIILTWSQGSIPWPAICMAMTFGLYGLIKKMVQINPWTGLTLETMIIAPFALIYLLFFAEHSFLSYSTKVDLVLVGAGIVTAIPLLLFAEGTKRISYTMIGFLQYLAPTLMLVMAVVIYDETFTLIQGISFLFIWIALIIYTASNLFRSAKNRKAAAN